MSSKLLIASAALFAAVSAQAAVSVNSASFTYSQSFDALAATGSGLAWANDSTLTGWSLFAVPAITTYGTSTGSNGSTAGFFSFGSAGNADRALGAVVTNAFAGAAGSGTVSTALALTNNSGSELTSFTVRYDGEQWRNNGNASAQSLVLQYGFGSSFAGISWTNAGSAFNFTSPVTGASAASVDGNVAGKVANLGGTVTTSWAAGSTLWLRWADLNDAGNDHLLAIDNVSLSVTAAVPEPGTYAMLLAGLGAIGFVARRRRG
jgi:hypothetical protein